jgi:hypothetical protein
MTKGRKPRESLDARPAATISASDDQVERALGRVFAIGLPVASITGAVVMGALIGTGSALLVLAGGALLGAIALFWASVRTLSGDSPLPRDLAMLGAERHGEGALFEEKRRVLRALKDLESEHEIGKIDDADYQSLVATYREQAKDVMRKLDIEVAPYRDQAERLVNEHLNRLGMQSLSDQSTAETESSVAARIACHACRASNEADATYCKQCGSSLTKDSSRAQA